MFWHPRGHDLSTSDQSLTIEQMLTIVKDLEREPRVPTSAHPVDATSLRRGLHVLIQKAVFEGKTSRPGHLNRLLAICRTFFEHTTWASFNWDCIFESSYWYSQAYGGQGSRSNPALAIPIQGWHGGSIRHTFMKLHGGINWWDIGGRITYLRWSGGGDLQRKWDEYDTNPAMVDRPVILEPSFYKYQDSAYRQLGVQWEQLFDRFLEADYVIIIGYSLPEMDINARSTILTAFQSNPTCKWLIVDPSEQVCNLYNQLLGSQRVTILEMKLSEFNNDIDTNLRSAFPGFP